MTNVQLYLTIGIPTTAVLTGILLNGFLYSSLSSRMSSLEATVTTRFDLLMTKLMEMDSRLSVVEDRLKR